jgi:hypothetical protein
MTTSKAKITDKISVEFNGQVDGKGPDEDRLKNHADQVKRFKEGTNEVKGPSPARE